MTNRAAAPALTARPVWLPRMVAVAASLTVRDWAPAVLREAVKVATHDRQTFYNVCHHAFLDRAGGRLVHFEGTYTNDFSGNPDRTPRYNYNQVLYRLDLGDPALRAARVE